MAQLLTDPSTQPRTRRAIPSDVCVALWFGRPGAQRAWCLLALALVPIWYVTRDETVDPLMPFAFLGGTSEVQGHVIEVLETGRKTLGTDAVGLEWERVTYKGIRYQYVDQNGKRHTGTAHFVGSRGSGTSREVQQYADVGVPVPVTFSHHSPEVSSVKGMRRADSAKQWLLGGLFWLAAIGAGCAVLAIVAGWAAVPRLSALLSAGRVTTGRLTAIRPAGWLEKLGFRQLIYNFDVNGRENSESILSDLPDARLDEEVQTIVHDARRPGSFVVLSHLSGRPDVSADGDLVEGGGNAYHCLWAPAICVMAYAWFVLDVLGISSPPGL